MVERNAPAVIVDPFELFREGLRRVLFEAGFQPVWCSDRPPAGPIAELSSKSSPLLIIGTEIEEAVVQIAEVKRLYPFARVVLLLDISSRDQLLMAFRSGAYTYLSRGTSCETLVQTLRLVMDGNAVLPSELLDLLLEPRENQITIPPELVPGSPEPSASFVSSHGLSARELMVVPRLREGLSNKEIARQLGISEATVKVHVKALLRKARVRNRTQLAMWATRVGLHDPAQTGDTLAEA